MENMQHTGQAPHSTHGRELPEGPEQPRETTQTCHTQVFRSFTLVNSSSIRHNHQSLAYYHQHPSNTCVSCCYTCHITKHSHSHQQLSNTDVSRQRVRRPPHLPLHFLALYSTYRPYSSFDYNRHPPPRAHGGGKVVNKKTLHVDSINIFSIKTCEHEHSIRITKSGIQKSLHFTSKRNKSLLGHYITSKRNKSLLNN